MRLVEHRRSFYEAPMPGGVRIRGSARTLYYIGVLSMLKGDVMDVSEIDARLGTLLLGRGMVTAEQLQEDP